MTMHSNSIKTKLILWYLLIQAIILFSFTYALFINVRQDISENIYATLKTVAIDIKEDFNKAQDDNDSVDIQKEEKEFYIKPLFLRLAQIDTQGNITITQTTDKDFTPPITPQAFSHKDEESSIFTNYGDMYMVTIPQDEGKIIQLATINKEATAAIDNFLYILLTLNPFILILSSIGGYFLMNRYLLPIKNILNRIQTITANDLSLRIETNENNDEIDKLSHAFNHMLERLENSFYQIVRFSSDASHELKTPLTVIRGEIEIALRKERSSEEYKEILIKNLDEVIKIQSTIENLLFLSEAENATIQAGFEVAYLDEIVSESIKEMQKIAHAKNIQILPLQIEPCEVEANVSLLKVAFNNLIKNALDYSNPHTKILVSLHKTTGGAIFKVVDEGNGISQSDMEHIFDRFYRADKSRTRTEGGNGLGLSIVKTIFDLHKANIEYISKVGEGTTVIVSLVQSI